MERVRAGARALSAVAATVSALVFAVALGPSQARAQPAAATGDFGPVVTIEAVEITGNTVTAERLIHRALGVRAGEVLHSGDRRLGQARHRILAMGYFRDVDVSLRKGSDRGLVVLVVRVVERGTVVLDRMYFGNTLITPWWAGLALTERNFLGTGIGVGAGAVFAGAGDASGADDQKAFQLRIDDPSLLGGPVGVHGSAYYVDASEPYRVAGDFSDGAAGNFAAFDYRRVGARAGATVALTPLTRLSGLYRFESVETDLPSAPARVLSDGTSVPIDLLLEGGSSRVSTVGALLEHDSRPDPILPYAGQHLVLMSEGGAAFTGSSYDYVSLLARYGRWWTVAPRHVLSVHLMGGAVFGDAPRFERLHVGDINRMVSPRALGLVVSTTPPFDFFDSGSDQITYGEVGGLFETQYAFQLFRNRRHIYGGDLFIGVGLWSLTATRSVAGGDPEVPIDLLLDAGLRLDTEIGIFELSLANALGRVPL